MNVVELLGNRDLRGGIYDLEVIIYKVGLYVLDHTNKNINLLVFGL